MPPSIPTYAPTTTLKSLDAIQELSSIRIYLAKDLTGREARKTALKTVCEVERRFKGSIPVLDPISDMNIRDEGMELFLQKKSSLEARRDASPIHAAEDRPTRFAEYSRKAELTEKIRLLRKEAKASQTLVMRDQLRRMRKVLKRLGHTNNEQVIDVKGRVACEVTSAPPSPCLAVYPIATYSSTTLLRTRISVKVLPITALLIMPLS